MTDFKRVQWYSGNTPDRQFNLYGVSKVHLEDPRINLRYNVPRTLCGRDIDTRPGRVIDPPKGEVCIKCEIYSEGIELETPDTRLIDHGVVSQEVFET